jgi:hypothetical protein
MKNKLSTNKVKSEFDQKKMDFLRHILLREGVRPNPRKLQAIRDWKRLVTIKRIGSFLGMANCCWKFIKGFSQMAKLFSDLFFLNLSYKWKEDKHRAFEDLKENLSFVPTLKFWTSPNCSKFTLTQVTSLSTRFSCKMDTQLLSRVRSSMEHNCDG